MKIDRRYRIHEVTERGGTRESLQCVWIFRVHNGETLAQRFVDVGKWMNDGYGKPDWTDEWPRTHLEYNITESPDSGERYNGVAIATDGFALSVVPILLDTWENGGHVDSLIPIPRHILTKAFAIKKSNYLLKWDWPDVSIKLEDDRVTLADGSIWPISKNPVAPPDFHYLMLQELKNPPDSDKPPSRPITFDPVIFTQVCKSIGVPPTGTFDPHGGVILERSTNNIGAYIVRPARTGTVTMYKLTAPIAMMMGTHIR